MEKTLIYLVDKSDRYNTNSKIKNAPTDSIINLIMSQHKKFSKIYLLDNELVMGAVIQLICRTQSESIFDKITIIEREDFELDLTSKLDMTFEKVIEEIEEENHLFFYLKGDKELEETLEYYVQTIDEVSKCSIYNLDNGIFKSKSIKSEKMNGDIEKAKLAIENKKMREELSSREFLDFIGESKKIIDIKARLKRIKKTKNTTVLIQGETGTGKGVVAKWIMLNHETRKVKNPRDFTFVINKNIPKETLNGSLFGELKGSHAGAKEDKDGIFLRADKKILFLDEIGDLGADAQAMLLRAIGDGEIQLTGASKPKKVDVMFITATNKNIKDINIMRDDLYARLNLGAGIYLPPIRERKEDIPLLMKYLIDKANDNYNWKLSDSCLQQISQSEHEFPKNARSLETLLEKINIADDFEGELEWHDIVKVVEESFQSEIPGDNPEDLSTSKRQSINQIMNKKARDEEQYEIMIKKYKEYLSEKKTIYGIHQWVGEKLEIPAHQSKNFIVKYNLDLKTMLKLYK